MTVERLIRRKILNSLEYDRNYLERAAFVRKYCKDFLDKEYRKRPRWVELMKEEEQLNNNGIRIAEALNIRTRKDPCHFKPPKCLETCYLSGGCFTSGIKKCPHDRWSERFTKWNVLKKELGITREGFVNVIDEKNMDLLLKAKVKYFKNIYGKRIKTPYNKVWLQRFISKGMVK